MLTVVSPAKTLDYESEIPDVKHTKARLLEQSSELVDILKQKEPWQLSEMMGISDELAALNANRYQDWKVPFTKRNARPAIYAFKGDVYTGLGASSLSESDIEFAQQHFRMLSGLYGVLRPLDLMQPYRLEMGTKLENSKGTNLYQFWDSQITETLNKDLKRVKTGMLINLASNEYFRSVKVKELKADVITPVFKDLKGNQYKVVSFWAKKARGLMARFIIQNRLNKPEQLKEFDAEGYYFSAGESDGNQLVFLRDH